MPETRQSRIAKLTSEVNHRRGDLAILKHPLPNVSESFKERRAAHIQTLEIELQALEQELHQLRVEQIREESKAQ